jgi:hypothetical protein
MAQLDAERAFYAAFGALAYPYVSFPNGPKLNTPSDPIPADTLWHVLDTLYATSKAVGAGDQTIRYTGLFQVAVKAPVTDSFGNPFGTFAVGARAELIASTFKLGTSLPYPVGTPTSFAHCEEPTITHLGNVEPEWYTVIIRIPFHMDS